MISPNMKLALVALASIVASIGFGSSPWGP
jgi:hypothetical protein